MIRIFLLVLLAFVLIGCSDNGSKSIDVEAPYVGAYIVFDSVSKNIPYPNDILFSGSTNGRLNIAYEDSDADADAKFALNTLDGFSTTSPIFVGFNGEVDVNSLYGNLHFYEMDDNKISRELTPYISDTVTGEFRATVSGDKIVVFPLQPLSEATTYAIVLTDEIADSQGNPIAADIQTNLITSDESLFDTQGNPKFNLDMQNATKLEDIRLATIPIIDATLTFDKNISREDIVTAWSFKTQTIGDFLTNVNDANKSSAISIINTGTTTAKMGALGKADIWTGTVTNLAYYLGVASKKDPTAPIDDYFTDRNGNPVFNGMPRERARMSIPVLVTKPNDSSAAAINGAKEPWPIVIFQHDITKDRTDVLDIADALADVGYATIAIDLPLHGLDTNATGFRTSYERTFDLDLVDNTTGASGGDGIIDSSGVHYINLDSLLTFRDNIRQTTSDILSLNNALLALSDINTTEVGFNDIDYNKISFIGHSFGAMSSFGFLSTNIVESVTLAMPGGAIAELLNNSVKFAPIIEAKLSSKGIIKGSASYDSFILDTQTILDDGDPLNYAINLGVNQQVFAIEVVGNGVDGTSDQVIPNSVSTAPLSGTEPLLTLMQTLNLTATIAVKPNQAARFIEGEHNSFLDSLSSVAVTAEMQKQTASFVGLTGTKVVVTDESLLYKD